jgi:polyisoprenyl-phosphate glycosyltransferase
MTRISIVIPCYNEEAALPETERRLSELLERLVASGKVAPDSLIVYVDDGSRDRTWELIERFSAGSPRVAGIKLSRNVGHQRALLAGLLTAPGDALISIDADLQDDPEVIERMVDGYNAGDEVVYGVRRQRDSDTPFKRITARGFYRMMRLLGAEVLQDHADFRLMGRRAVDGLREFREVNLFLRGLVPLIGYPSSIVQYDRSERVAGESKYPLRKMLGLALDGVTSISSFPLRLITFTGLMVFLITVALSLWTVAAALLTEKTVPGWASTVLPIYFIGGVQILCIGILGEYAGKIYQEVKQRPRFLLEKKLGLSD